MGARFLVRQVAYVENGKKVTVRVVDTGEFQRSIMLLVGSDFPHRSRFIT